MEMAIGNCRGKNGSIHEFDSPKLDNIFFGHSLGFLHIGAFIFFLSSPFRLAMCWLLKGELGSIKWKMPVKITCTKRTMCLAYKHTRWLTYTILYVLGKHPKWIIYNACFQLNWIWYLMFIITHLSTEIGLLKAK